MSSPPSRMSFDDQPSRDSSPSLPVQLENLREQLSVQQAIADGARNFLAVVSVHAESSERDDADEQHELRLEIQRELAGAELSIEGLQYDIAVLEQQLGSTPSSDNLNGANDATYSPETSDKLDDERYNYPAVEKVQQLFEELQRLEDEIGQRIKIMDEIVDSFQDDPKLSIRVRPTSHHSDALLRGLGENAGKDLRSATYRLIRHGLCDAHDTCVLLLERHLHLHLIRSLAKDAKHDLEKEQALRLIRKILEYSTLSSSSTISVEDHHRLQSRLISILRGVVAIAEQADEKLRLSALETLGELVIRDVSLLVKCEGLRVVLQAMSDGGGTTGAASGGGAGAGSTYNEMSSILAMSFVGIVDHPELRKWLRPGIDLEIVLSGFTEVHGKGSGMEERIKATSSIVETLFKSWSGLLYLNVNGRQALTSLVDSLTNPSRIIRDALLDMLSNIFSVHRRPVIKPVDRLKEPFLPARSTDPQTKTNLIDQFTAILLLTFIDAGLIEGLAELAANPQDSSTSLRVSTLIGEILDLSNRILPARHAAVLQSLPRLFSLSTIATTTTTTEGRGGDGAAGDEKLRASDTLIVIAGLNREKRHAAASRGKALDTDDDEGDHLALPDCATSATGPAASSFLRNSQQRQLVESDRLRVALSIDDVSFRNLLLETGVLSTKEDAKWSVDLLIELLQGPLKNPKRLDETMRASKFMKRLLAFFHPLNWRYSDTIKDESTVKYTRLGCTMIRTLLSDPQGVQYLAEDKLLPQIADCLLQLEPIGISVPNGSLDATVFSKDRVETMLVGGYFDMLGEMTRAPAGLALLDQYKIFTCFYRVGELRNREDLVRAVLEKCDYTRDGHSRVFLHKTLTSSYKHIRLFATKHLASLIRQSCLDLPSSSSRGRAANVSASNHEALEWQVDLVVAQLYDPAPEVAQLAIAILTRICARSEQGLDMVVRKQPQVEHLGDAAAPLLTQFLASPGGVDYLHEIDFIEQELDDWYEERNYRYMVDIELSLASALQIDGGVLPPTTFDGTPPSHFYGELVKTLEGCEILDESEHFLRFCDVIRDHADEQQVLDPEYISQLKSVLWAVGHIGSTENGLAFIEDEFILPDIVEIACTSPVYSLRGTAVFALALISSTEEGVEMLEELGWESVHRPLTGPTGLCIPMELNDLVFTPTWPAPSLPLPESVSFSSPSSQVDQAALVALANLSNHILATKASKQLAKLKHRHRSHFSSSSTNGPTLYYRALDMLASHHYRQPVRKYVLELFDFDLDTREDIDRVMNAGRDLVRTDADQYENENGVAGMEKWPRAAVESMMLGGGGSGGTGSRSGVAGGGGALEGEVTEDEDQSSLDGNDDDLGGAATGKKVALQVLTPLLTVRGFLLS